MDSAEIREQVLAALQHPEGEEGLYLDNFYHLHEEDERPRVNASEGEILEVLKTLVAEGRIVTDDSDKLTIYKLAD